MRKLLPIAVLIVSAISLALTIVFAYEHFSYKQQIDTLAKDNIIGLTKRAADKINAILKAAESAATSLADDLTSGELKKEDIHWVLKGMVEKRPYFYGATITYRPYTYAPDRRLYSAYFNRQRGQLEYVQLDKVYDYTEPEHEWYMAAMQKGSRWCDPYFCEAGATLMTTYSALFYDKDKGASDRSPVGVVTVDISLDDINRIIKSLDLGPSGFGALLTQNGIYLYHPNEKFVKEKTNIREVARRHNDRDRMRLAEKIAQRENGIINHRSITTGLSSWLVYEPIPAAGWSLQNTFIKSDIEFDVDTLRRQLIRIAFVTIFFLVSFMCLVFRIDKGRTLNIALTATATAIILLAGIGSMWYFALVHHSGKKAKGTPISEWTSLEKIVDRHNRRCLEKRAPEPNYIPTGVYIESLDLTRENDVILAGQIWQKYKTGPQDLSQSKGDMQDEIKPDFVINRVKNFETTFIDQRRQGDWQVNRWHFRATLRKQVSSSKYPLDKETIELEISDRSSDENMAFIPDLGSYHVTSPTALPGIYSSDVLPGWKLLRSFFELREKKYPTSFGIDRSVLREDFPALIYNIEITRNFLDVFISNLAPLIIVAFLLYFLLVILTGDESRIRIRGAEPGKSLSYCAGLLFVVVFSHIGVRRGISAEEIFYLEYFHLVLYLSLLLVSLNSVLFLVTKKVSFIHYKENFVPKLLYWPLILGTLFFITMVTFY